MDILDSARKHGVRDADLRHAVDHNLGEFTPDEDTPWKVLYLGPDRAGNLLEVVTVERDDGSEVAIHAMKMRRKYEQLLTWRR